MTGSRAESAAIHGTFRAAARVMTWGGSSVVNKTHSSAQGRGGHLLNHLEMPICKLPFFSTYNNPSRHLLIH